MREGRLIVRASRRPFGLSLAERSGAGRETHLGDNPGTGFGADGAVST